MPPGETKFSFQQGPNCTGNTGKMTLLGKTTGNLEILQNTEKFVCSSCKVSLIQKVKDMAIFAAKIPIFFRS